MLSGVNFPHKCGFWKPLGGGQFDSEIAKALKKSNKFSRSHGFQMKLNLPLFLQITPEENICVLSTIHSIRCFIPGRTGI